MELHEKKEPGRHFEKGPVSPQNRSVTDHRFLIIFLITCTVWLVLGHYVLNHKDRSQKMSVVQSLNHFIQDSSASFRISEILEDYEVKLQNLWNRINITAGCTLLSLFLCVTYIFLLRSGFAKLLVCFTVWLFSCGLIIVAVKSISCYCNQKPREKNFKFIIKSFVGFFSAASIVTIASYFCKEIRMACVLVKEVCRHATIVPVHLLVVIIEILGKFIIFDVFIKVLLFTPSIWINSTWLIVFQIFNAIMFLWTWNFFSGIKKIVLSGIFATWYWTFDKKELSKDTLRKFSQLVFKFHLGTVACGSLIIPICNSILLPLKKLVGHINNNAYVVCAIYGTDFFKSGKYASVLIKTNRDRIFVKLRVTKLIYWLGALYTIFIPTVLAYQLCSNISVHEVFGVTTFIFIHSVIVTLVIFDIIDTAADTIFMCIYEDIDRNDGSEYKPYFLSEKLKKIMLLR